MKEFGLLKLFIGLVLIALISPYIFTKDKRSEVCRHLDRLTRSIDNIRQTLQSKF